MKPENHIDELKEIFSNLDMCIENGIENYQRIIGFLTSLGAVEMLELYLHKHKYLSYSARFNHGWMKSQKKLKEKVSFEFPGKAEIIRLIYYIEKNRNDLCYGKKCDISKIEEQLNYFNELRILFKEACLDEIQ